MKLTKYIPITALALAIAGTISAQTKIYITGSTAFRTAASTEITNSLSGTVSIAYDGASSGVTGYKNANAVTWSGGNIGGTPVTIKASWSGSGSGIQPVAGFGHFPVYYLPDSANSTNTATTSDPRKGPSGTALYETYANGGDIAFSDIYQASTYFNGTFNGVTYATLTPDTLVGVVTFEFAASNGFPANMSMTPQLAQALFTIGGIPLSQFDGNSAHQLIAVLPSGRNPDSGTRGTTLAETGIGVFTSLQQWKPTVSNAGTATAQITSMTLYPVETINGVSTNIAGNSGESSGGTLRGYLNTTLSSAAAGSYDSSSTSGYLLTYLGVSDANSAIGAANLPAVPLNYCGVPFSQSAVELGQYTFWGYEHCFLAATWQTNGGIQKTFYNNLTSNILGESDSQLSPNCALTNMTVARTADGQNVTSKTY